VVSLMSIAAGKGMLSVEVCLVSMGAHPLAHRVHRPHRRVPWLLAGLVAAAGILVGIDRVVVPRGGRPGRPALQRILDQLVRNGVAPGVTAYVKTAAPMRPDARLRIESLSKTWLTVALLRLAQDGKLSLDDTVQRWLPGLLRGHGSKITIRELMTDSSGLIDDNDIWQATPARARMMLARVRDAKLRTQLVAAVARYNADPASGLPALVFIRTAAWQPLVAARGTTYHHSNIGWNIAGLIAARAAGKPLPVLYQERIFRPLRLRETAFSPQGPIAGQHARGYTTVDGRLVDQTAIHPGKFADGAIVTDARDEATFLRAAMNGTLFDKTGWLGLYGPPAGATGCGRPAYGGEGSGNGYHGYVWYDDTGKRVAVLLLNRDRVNAAAAARRLYCGA
jgi:CubicO group peptidase (beta-lactamase class C family)